MAVFKSARDLIIPDICCKNLHCCTKTRYSIVVDFKQFCLLILNAQLFQVGIYVMNNPNHETIT